MKHLQYTLFVTVLGLSGLTASGTSSISPEDQDDHSAAYTAEQPTLTKEEKLKQAIKSWAVGLPKERACEVVYLPRPWWKKGTFVEAVPANSEDSYLMQLGKKLHCGYQAASMGTTSHDVAVSGLGGVGKSFLALAYANLARKHKLYDLIHWINAENQDQILEGYDNLLYHFDIKAERQEKLHLLNALRKKLADQKHLIVYDNVATPRTLSEDLSLLGGAGHILITSRYREGGGQSLELGVFSPQESIDYLFRSTGIDGTEKNRALAGDIAKEVGYLPLALEHVGSYLRETEGDFDWYLKKFREEREDLTGYAIQDAGEKTVATTWKTTMDKLIGEEDEDKCGELLGYCAYLSADNIPSGLFKTGNREEEELVDTGLELLSRYSMIKRNKDYISVHPLLQWVTRQEQERLGHPLVANFADMFQGYIERNFGSGVPEDVIYTQAINIIPHMTTILNSEAHAVMEEEHKNKLATFGRIFMNSAIAMSVMNSGLAENTPLDHNVLSFAEKTFAKYVFDPDRCDLREKNYHPLLLSIVGTIYDYMKDYSKSLSWLEEAAKHYSLAQYILGKMYCNKDGVEQDDQKAADQGDAEASKKTSRILS